MSELELNHDRIGDFRNLALSCRPGQLQMTVATGWTPDGYQGAQGAHDACVGNLNPVSAINCNTESSFSETRNDTSVPESAMTKQVPKRGWPIMVRLF